MIFVIAFYLNCLGVHFSAFCLKAKIKGLWPVYTPKVLASNMWRKHLIARYAANSSLSKVEYFRSAGLIFLEKKHRGSQTFPTSCWRAAPIAVSDASANSANGASGLEWASKVASERCFFDSAKAFSASSVQEIGLFTFAWPNSSDVSGACISDSFGINLL